jgi:hypothetical protein
LLLHRYNNIDYILELNYINGIELINKAREKESERSAWEMWLTLYPNMDKKNFIPFSKFYQKQTEPQIRKATLTNEEIIAKNEELRLAHQGKHKGIKTE